MSLSKDKLVIGLAFLPRPSAQSLLEPVGEEDS